MTDFSTPQVNGSTPATGKALLSACWKLLRQDRELLWLPAIAAITGLVAAGILFVPGFALGRFVGGDQHHQWGIWLGFALAVFASSCVAIYFQAALVIGANQRADGGDPTLRGVLESAWTRRKQILGWAGLNTTVGLVIRALEERLGFLGNLLGFLGGLAWAIASFLVVPVLVVEDLGPIEAVKRSKNLVRDTWGPSLRTTLRIGFAQLLFIAPAFIAIFIGIATAGSGSTAAQTIGVLLIIAGFVSILVLGMIFSAISSYARALIYRYATGQPVPGIDPQLFIGVFRPKRSRRRLFV